jgi:plasmid stabilization system protein ParE
MSRPLVVLPGARREITEASDWYQAIGHSLGAVFRAEIRACFDRLRANPFRYQRIHGEARAALLARFPYSIVFTASADGVLVVACFHQRRDPENWHARLP